MSFNILNQPVLLPSSTLPPELDLRLKMPSTATVSHFATLPVEICLDIFRLFCHHCQDPTMQYDYHGDDEAQKELASNISSLCSLSRTCRGLRALAQPILHHHFPTQSPSCEAQALYRFVRTITQRPDLADAVRVIELDQEYWSWRRGVDDTGHPGSFNEMDEFAEFHGDVAETQDPARIEQAARRFGLLPRDAWHFVTHLSTRCYTPNADPWTDKHRWLMLGTEECALFGRLALCLCANTQLVDFGRFIQHYDPWVANPSLPSWPNVECVRVRGESWPGRANRRPGVGPAGDMANLAGLTDRLPNLKTLQLQFCASRGDGREGLGAAGGNPSPAESLRGLDLSCLLRLDLTFCTLSRDRLAQLLEMCASLTEFSFLALGDVELHQVAARHPANPREVADLLQNHCPRLHRKLRRLRLEHFDNLDWWPSAVHGPMTNLTALRTVHLGANGLFTYPWADTRVLPGILPPNIEVLGIVEAREWSQEVNSVSEALIHLLEAMLAGEARFDRLRSISVSFSPRWDWLEYMDRSGVSFLGTDWWWAVHSPLDPEPVPELDPRVAELAEEAGIELDVERISVSEEVKLKKKKLAEDSED